MLQAVNYYYRSTSLLVTRIESLFPECVDLAVDPALTVDFTQFIRPNVLRTHEDALHDV